MVLALGDTGVQNMLEAGGDGKHEDNGDRSGEANDIVVSVVIEEVVLKGARDAGDKQHERWAEVAVHGGTDMRWLMVTSIQRSNLPLLVMRRRR